MQVETVSIIGLNRLTASAGLAIKQKLSSLKIVGFDPDGQRGESAANIGAIDSVAPNLKTAAAKGDIVILGYPYTKTKALLVEIGPLLQTHAVVTDFGPLKRPVQELVDKYMENGHFVCAMPIPNVDALEEGDNSVKAASVDLFRDSLFCLMPSPKVDQGAVETVAGLGRVFGTEPYFIDIDEYDVYAQALETLPTLLAAALFRGLSTQTGWGDLQKLAGHPFALATKLLDRDENVADLIQYDQKGTVHWLNLMLTQIEQLRDWVQQTDHATLDELLKEIAYDREKWVHMRRKNDWTNVSPPNQEESVMAAMLLGGLGGRLRRRNDD